MLYLSPVSYTHLSSPNARCAYQDCYGNIWIGNYRGGIYFISHTQPMFNILPYTIETAKGLSYKQVWGMWATDNQVWLGSEDESVSYTHLDVYKRQAIHCPYFSNSSSVFIY